MKKTFIFFITLLFLYSPNVKAQNKAAGAEAIVGAAASIGTATATVKQMEERAELKATQWVLSNAPELTSFSIKTLSFNGKKLKDISQISVIIYKIQEFIPADKPKLNGKKFVLLGFTSHGWVNEYGINFNKVQWFLIDKEEWLKMMTSYVKVSSGDNDENKIEETLKEGRVVNNGVRVKSRLVIPFYKLTSDMYLVTDYSQNMKLIYNERSLGIFLNKTKDLVQIRRGDIIDIQDFFFSN